MPGPPEVKILGIERSGTNLLHLLLDRHYLLDLLEDPDSGLKHGPYDPRRFKRHVNVAIVSKHMASWLHSIWRFRYRRQTFGEFLADHGKEEADKWNDLYLEHLSFQPGDMGKAMVRYEDLLVDPQAECRKVADALGLETSGAPFEAPSMRMRKDNTEGRRPFDPSWYLERRFLASYSPAELERAREWTSRSVEEGLGYSEEDWG